MDAPSPARQVQPPPCAKLDRTAAIGPNAKCTHLKGRPSCPTPEPSPAPPRGTADRTLRRPDRRRRHLRRGRRLSPHPPVPRHQLRRARNAGKLRRHLDHAQISGHPLGQRPLHLRLSLQALDHRADRDGSGNPEIHGRGHRRERPRPAYSLPAPDRRRGLVQRNEPLDHRRHQHRNGRAGPHHHQLPVDVPGLLPPFRGLHAAVGRHGNLQGNHRPPADLAHRSRLHGQERRRHRLGRHGGDAHSGDGGRRRPRHDAAALADLFQDRPQRGRDRRRVAGAGH